MAEPAVSAALGTKALRGGRYLAAGTVIERLARLGRNMLLARVIAPEHFGLMAITLAVTALYSAITEVGVAQAVIQDKRGSTREFLNVAWWFGLVRGLLVAAVAVPLAAPIASFYGEPLLTGVLMVAPLSVVFAGLTSPRVYALQRDFRFKATLWTMQGAGLLGVLVSIGLGFWLQNVWALVWGAVFEAFARFVLSFILCPIRLSFRLDPVSRSALFRFTKGMAGLPILTLLIMQADVFVLGRVVTAVDLGLYTMAIALAGFPLALFSKVVQPLVVPILVTAQDDPPAMSRQVLTLTRLVWLFCLPLAAVMSAVAGPLLVLVYGRPEFGQAAPAFAVYSLFAVVYMASMISFSVYLALGQPELQRRFTLVRALVLVVVLYPASLWLGGTGAALALLVAMVLAMVVQLLNLRRVIGLRILDYLATMVGGLVAGVLAGAAALSFRLLVAWPGWAVVIGGALIGALAWGLILMREYRTLAQLRHTSEGGAPTASEDHDGGTHTERDPDRIHDDVRQGRHPLGQRGTLHELDGHGQHHPDGQGEQSGPPRQHQGE